MNKDNFALLDIHNAALREGLFRRMWDVNFFMKGLKQRFSGWHNRWRRRKATLWEERFKSVLMESGQALVTMATCIRMIPVQGYRLFL